MGFGQGGGKQMQMQTEKKKLQKLLYIVASLRLRETGPTWPTCGVRQVFTGGWEMGQFTETTEKICHATWKRKQKWMSKREPMNGIFFCQATFGSAFRLEFSGVKTCTNFSFLNSRVYTSQSTDERMDRQTEEHARNRDLTSKKQNKTKTKKQDAENNNNKTKMDFFSVECYWHWKEDSRNSWVPKMNKRIQQSAWRPPGGISPFILSIRAKHHFNAFCGCVCIQMLWAQQQKPNGSINNDYIVHVQKYTAQITDAFKCSRHERASRCPVKEWIQGMDSPLLKKRRLLCQFTCYSSQRDHAWKPLCTFLDLRWHVCASVVRGIFSGG